MRHRNLSGSIISQADRAPRPDSFADAAAWTAHLGALGLSGLKVLLDPVMIATEGALWGAIIAHDCPPFYPSYAELP